MKRAVLCLVFVVLVGLLYCPTAPGAEPAKTGGWLTPTVATVPVSATVEEGEAEPEEVSRRFLRKQRRAMGATFGNVFRIMREMDAAGELEGKESSIVAIEVFERLMDEAPEAFEQSPGIDPDTWARILELIMQLLEILVPILINIFFRT